MLIWSRWGFLSFLGFGVGVGLAFLLLSPLGLDSGPLVGATIFACAAAVNALLAFLVYPRLDKPRPATFTRPLAQAVRHPNGAVQTHEVLPALDPEGRPLWHQPRSTLFFIPARLIWIGLLAVAVVLSVVSWFRD